MRIESKLKRESDSGVAFAQGQVPLPPHERGSWAVAAVVGILGVAVLVAVLSGMIGGAREAPAATAPPVLVVSPTPTRTLAAAERAAIERASAQAHRPGSRASSVDRAGRGKPIVQAPSSPEQSEAFSYFPPEGSTHIFARWVAGFYSIYATAQRTFDVNWLLIASIHKQETAFSTAASTYHGLNFAHCCGGPMQFNVTNGPVTTWALVRGAYHYAPRPALYNHMTSFHPSIYDDFDSIMAAAWLLSADGARIALNDSAWWAAYDYYGHDATGVWYADQVLARAIGWSQHGFCINCEVEQPMVQAVHEAYGAPVLASLESSVARHPKHRHRKARRASRNRS
jgi:hypothetical protein